VRTMQTISLAQITHIYVPRASFIRPYNPWDIFPQRRYSADITKRLPFSRTLMNLLHFEIQNREQTCAIWFPAIVSSLPVSGSTVVCASSAVFLDSPQLLMMCEPEPFRSTITHITPISQIVCHIGHAQTQAFAMCSLSFNRQKCFYNLCRFTNEDKRRANSTNPLW
jgi:hypothetical protein